MKSTLTASESNSLTKQVLAGNQVRFFINSARFGLTAKILEEYVQPAIMQGQFLAEIPLGALRINSFRRLGYYVVPITAQISIAYWDDEALVRATENRKEK